MSAQQERAALDAQPVADLLPPLRRYVAARALDRSSVEDVVQESVSRVLARRSALDDQALLPYAMVVARNLIAEGGRDELTRRRHLHRLVDGREPDQPDAVTLRREEAAAVSAALAALPEPDRRALVAHVVEDQDTASLAAAGRSTPGGVAAQLARARARARVDYLLALRHVQLPTARCRPVLMALSMGDRRRQHALGAGRHLLSCTACADLSEPLTTRQRALAGLAPFPLVAAGAGWVGELFSDRRAQATGAAAAALAAAAVAAAVLVPGGGGVTAAAPAPAGPAVPVGPAAPEPAAPLPGAAGLIATVGRVVTAESVLVLSVPADEGFWVGSGEEDRVWVRLPSSAESPKQVLAGQRASFTGRTTLHLPGFAAAAGVSDAEGGVALDAAGAHVVLDLASLQLT